MRGRVLAETSGKSPKPAKQNNHHETAYAALDWDIGPDTTAGVGYLYQQRHITPDNGLPTYKNGKLLPCRKRALPAPTGTTLKCRATTPSPAARSMTSYR